MNMNMRFRCRPRRRACVLVVSWIVIWTTLWCRYAPPIPKTRIRMPGWAFLHSVSETGIAGAKPFPNEWNGRNWNVKTGEPFPGPFRPDDKSLIPQVCRHPVFFVLRDGVPQQIDPQSGETVRRFDQLARAENGWASPDHSKMIISRPGIGFDVVDTATSEILWSASRPQLNEPDLVDFVDDRFAWGAGAVFDARTGEELGVSERIPLAIGKRGDRWLALSERTKSDFETNAYEVHDLKSQEVVKTLYLTFAGGHPMWHDPLRMEFSPDGNALLWDRLNEQNQLETVRCDIVDINARQEFVYAPLSVAANGNVLQFQEMPRSPQAARWDSLWQMLGQKLPARLFGFLYAWRGREGEFQSTVFDSSGKCLLQISHTSGTAKYGIADARWCIKLAYLIDGGRGLVIENNRCIEYYEIPGRIRFPAAYWLILLTPLLAALGISASRSRRANNVLAASASSPP